MLVVTNNSLGQIRRQMPKELFHLGEELQAMDKILDDERLAAGFSCPAGSARGIARRHLAKASGVDG